MSITKTIFWAISGIVALAGGLFALVAYTPLSNDTAIWVFVIALIVIIISLVCTICINSNFKSLELSLEQKMEGKVNDSFCNDRHKNIGETISTKIIAEINKLRSDRTKSTIDELLEDFCHSPISLGDKEIDIIKKAKFDKYVEKKKQIFIKQFEKDKPKNRAEGLKNTVFSVVVLDEEGKIDLNKLKDAGYQEGKTETQIQIIAGIYVWLNIVEPFLYEKKDK